MHDRIEKSIDIAAPVERVWRALIDHDAFGAWFGVQLDDPFRIGEEATGRITHPGYEHVRWAATVVAIEPPRRFAFTWKPYAIDPAVVYAAETPTTVEFLLEPNGEGARLVVIESGFERVPAHRRDEAFRMNARGWAAQVQNIRAYAER